MNTTRRTVLGAAAPALASAGGLLGSAATAANRPTAVDPEVGALVERATQAHAALMQGDLDRYLGLIQTSDDFAFMGPFGGKPTRGADFSAERWAAIGRFFRNGRDSTLELVQAWRTDNLAVLAVIERTVAEVGGLPAQPWALRVTLVFRREAGQWLLAHRHADPLVEGISLKHAAALSSGKPS